jgi:hypothetical protein
METALVSVGQRFDCLLDERTRAVSATGNKAGYPSMLPDIVGRIQAERPNLSAEEKDCLRRRCAEFAHRFCGRTGTSPHDFTGALGRVAQLLA